LRKPMNDVSEAPFFYCPPEHIEADVLSLPPEEARHLTRVLRKRPGDLIQVTDGVGNRLVCRISSAEGRSVDCTIVERSAEPYLVFPAVVLAVSMIRKERL